MKDRKLFNLLYLFIAASIMFFNVGCSEDSVTPPVDPVNESEVLAKYFEANNDYINGVTFVMGASVLKTNILTNASKTHIIDLRDTSHYNAKRLKGAVSVSLSNLGTYFKNLNTSAYDNIVLVCYSGQTSAYATSLMRAMGYGNKVVSLKFGMSSIDSSFAQNYWLSKTGSPRVGQFVTTPAPAYPQKGTMPAISTGKTNPTEILEARINTLLSQGYSSVGATPQTASEATVYSNSSNYFIANYWENALYLNPGHIDGAYNYPPTTKPFQYSKELLTLPTNKPVIVYCFTGQSSSYVIGYLRALGYDARSLLYGANSMIHSTMFTNNVANTWKASEILTDTQSILEP